MKIILVRHGGTRESEKGILLGHLPGSLSLKEKKEIAKIARDIKKFNLNPEIIFSSDLKRAKDSAEILAKTLKLNIKYDKLLRERKGGIAEGKKENEINCKEYERISLPHRKHKGGESFLDVKNRTERFLKYLEPKKYKAIILVSHNAFLAMLVSYVKNLSIKKSLKTNFDSYRILNLK